MPLRTGKGGWGPWRVGAPVAFRFLGVVGALFFLVSVYGCALPADLGVTSGGQQDVAAARRTIEDGGIPDPQAITVEGFLSEHGIPLEAPPDAGMLYATTGVAWNADFDVFAPLATVVVGFGTTLEREAFQREPLNLCLVIDRSGSMAERIDDRSGTSKLEAVKIAVDRVLAKLDENDRVSVVAFNDRADVLRRPVPGNDVASIKTAIDNLEAKRGTDLVHGMRRAYDLVRDYSAAGRADRILVFTDALLIEWETRRVNWFLDTMREFAADDIGATVFGVGNHFGHEVAYKIAQVRGGNYYFLGDYERIVSVIDGEFDYLVTPIAYDVSLTVSVPFEFDVVSVHGLPVDDPLPRSMKLDLPTLFLSTREGGGAILIHLRPGAMVDEASDMLAAQITLFYRTPDGEAATLPVMQAVLPGGRGDAADARHFDNDGVRRAVLLLNTALVLQRACEDMQGSWSYYDYRPPNYGQAVARLTDFLPYFDELAEGLEDRVSEASRSLSQERALVEALLDNIRDGRYWGW